MPNFKVGDGVKVIDSIDADIECGVESKYRNQIGIVTFVSPDEDELCPIRVNFEGIGFDGFWPEELIKVKD